MPTDNNDPLAIPLRGDISPSIHPGYALEMEMPTLRQSALGEAGARAVGDAMASMYKAIGDVTETARQLDAAAPPPTKLNTVMGPSGRPKVLHGREEELAAAANKRFDAVGQIVDARLAAARAARDEVAKKVSVALNKSDGFSAAIRGHVNNLPDGKRDKFLRDAILSGDLQAVSAVVLAPHYLSGITADDHKRLTADAREKFAPQENSILQAMDRALSRAENAKVLFTKAMAPHLKAQPTRRTEAKVSLNRLATGGG